ncbi:hypothetical protein [Simonsiella muelleri]|uniref:hypothetical protein n=1 Tax=Simonsiella muelleri TaxID=72 RepID=UPI0023F239A1|nr:hypothetical protein [Simonsiella muelleri]
MSCPKWKTTTFRLNIFSGCLRSMGIEKLICKIKNIFSGSLKIIAQEFNHKVVASSQTGGLHRRQPAK